MAYLALNDGEGPLRAKDIAREVNIPAFYLSKILRQMVTAGLLTGTKGHGGGFVIAKPASKIRFSHILEAINADITTPTCVFGWDACSDKYPCVLHDRWKLLRKAFNSWANRTTLADVKAGLGKIPALKGMSLKERIRGNFGES